MESFAQLRDVDPYVFRQGEFGWFDMHAQLKDHGYAVRRSIDTLPGWSGEAAKAAKAALGEHDRRLQAGADTIHQAYLLFRQTGDRICAAKNRLADGLEMAASWQFTVTDDGGIVDPLMLLRGGAVPQAQQAMTDCQAIFQDALLAANRADAEISSALAALTAESVGLSPASVAALAPLPPQGRTPADVTKWWESLTPEQREALIYTPDSGIGMLDGVPAVDRDRANRFTMAEQRAELTTEKQRLEASPRTHEEQQRLDQVNGALRGIDDIDQRLHTIDPDHPPAYLLGFDSTGNGRAIVASGNPDTAANIATYVPGTGTNISKIGGDMERSDRMYVSANAAGSPSTSVITWIGYDAPATLAHAALPQYADNAKEDLDRFQDGLRATHEGEPSHNTVLGHSYGTTVVGHAARDEQLNVDEVVLIASPGAGVEHASDLNVPPEHVHSTTAQHDIIAVTNADPLDPLHVNPVINGDPHGIDPTDPKFGGNVFQSDPGTEGAWYTGGLSTEAHSEYWNRGSRSLENMGRIIAGQPTR